MDRLCDSFGNLLCDAGVVEPFNRTYLHPNIISKIEHYFEEFNKVSVTFLFYDDIDTCYKICEKCINYPNYNFLSDNSITDYSNWQLKLLECIFYVKHFLILKKLGIAKYDAVRYFESPKYVSEQRLMFYKICESLSNDETSTIMRSVPSLSTQKYLEMFILKALASESDMNCLHASYSSLNNKTVNNYLKMSFSHEERKKECFTVTNEVKRDIPKLINDKDDDIYPIIDPQNVGLCFIFNEVNFKGQPTRDGSMADVASLESTMDYFNFYVKTFSDVPRKFFVDDLCEQIELNFKTNHSVFFMVILSHGVPGAIYCSDDKPVTIDFITKQLSCKKLFNIPKVLIIQACQGDYLLKVNGLTTDGPGSIECDQLSPNSVKVGNHISDFLLAMATVRNFKAFRDPKEGTWFIQTLCKCLKENESKCILSIITHTIKGVKNQKIDTNFDFHVGQQPELRSLLDKKLYLKPYKNS